MSYVTNTEIASEFKNVSFGPSSAITNDEVDEFISQEQAVIDLTISNRYNIPVTGTDSVKILKRITSAFVAYRIAKILNLKKDIPIPEKLVAQDLSDGAFYLTAKKQLNDIRDGKIILYDADVKSSGQGVGSYNHTNAIDPLWERDTRQW